MKNLNIDAQMQQLMSTPLAHWEYFEQLSNPNVTSGVDCGEKGKDTAVVTTFQRDKIIDVKVVKSQDKSTKDEIL